MNLSAIRDNFTRYGLMAGLHDVAKKAAGRAVPLRVLDCLELTLDRVPRELLSPPPGFACRFLDEDELRRHGADPANHLDGDFLRQALGQGARCYGVLQDGALASYGWYARRPTDISPELRFHFDPRDVYMYKGYTRPELRGLRLHAVGMARALAELAAGGARALVSYVESNNFASLRSCRRLGYRHVGRILILQPRGGALVLPSRACRARGLSVEARGAAREGDARRSGAPVPAAGGAR